MKHLRSGRGVRVVVLLLGAVAVVGLAACNTVRGVAKDVTAVADAVDPDKQN